MIESMVKYSWMIGCCLVFLGWEEGLENLVYLLFVELVEGIVVVYCSSFVGRCQDMGLQSIVVDIVVLMVVEGIGVFVELGGFEEFVLFVQFVVVDYIGCIVVELWYIGMGQVDKYQGKEFGLQFELQDLLLDCNRLRYIWVCIYLGMFQDKFGLLENN